MRRSLFIAIAGVAAVLAACKGGKSDAGESFPADFNALPDTARVAYVMKNTTPDSVARFICRAALGQVKGAGIESLPMRSIRGMISTVSAMNMTISFPLFLSRTRCGCM